MFGFFFFFWLKTRRRGGPHHVGVCVIFYFTFFPGDDAGGGGGGCVAYAHTCECRCSRESCRRCDTKCVRAAFDRARGTAPPSTRCAFLREGRMGVVGRWRRMAVGRGVGRLRSKKVYIFGENAKGVGAGAVENSKEKA